MNFEDFLNLFKKIDGIKIVEAKNGPFYVTYEVILEKVQKDIEIKIEELKNQYGCDISLYKVDNYYKIILGSLNLESNLKTFSSKLSTILVAQEEERKKKYKEFGIPDLSLVTIRQMVEELKKRKNLVFSLVWIENNERDNIAIEGSGNPTQLIGLLTRGVHMAIDWADRSIRFNK